MIQFAAVVALVLIMVLGKQFRLPAGIAAVSVIVLMGGPEEFVKAVMAALPGM